MKNKKLISNAQVAVPLNVNSLYSYSFGEDLDVKVGSVVLVEIGNKETYGVVFSINENNYQEKELKPIKSVLAKELVFSQKMLKFLTWFSNYNMVPIGNVAKTILQHIDKVFQKKEVAIIKLKEESVNVDLNVLNRSPKKRELIEVLKREETIEVQDLKKAYGFSKKNIEDLLAFGIIEQKFEEVLDLYQNNFVFKPAELSKEQKKVAGEILDKISKSAYSVNLLEGLPGSGKTEVYFELINKMIIQQKQVLVMLPEIGLSRQWLERFQQRFAIKPYEWHSNISKANKDKIWKGVLNGDIKVVVGTRSSLFLPFYNLGLIILDEEHDSSFKQEEQIIYNARDMAIVRGKIEGAPIVLCSATPSIETEYNVMVGKYNHFKLNTRFNQNLLPEINIIDLKEEKLGKGENISKTLQENMESTLARNEQVLLFLNRRGFAPITICTECGHEFKCDNCSANLVEHKSRGKMLCHYCGKSSYLIEFCPSCNTVGNIKNYGVGVEKIKEEVQKKFVGKQIFIASSDTIRNVYDAEIFIKKVERKEIDIIIGTQLVSKGYDFPMITLVGIIDGQPSGLNSELKAMEKSWQIFYQVAGRAGRGSVKGSVVVQTYNKNNFFIEYLKNYDRQGFINQEIENRKLAQMPPFTNLAGIIVQGINQQQILDFCYEMSKKIRKDYKGYSIIGPSEAPIFKLRGKFRYRFLITAHKNLKIQNIITLWLQNIKIPSNIKLFVDIDPINFY